MSLLKDKIEVDIGLAELKTQQALQRFPPAMRWMLVICVVLIIPAYFIAKGASYRYWSKNYRQYLISAKPSFTNPKDPEKSDIFLTTTGNGNYGAAMQITNDNLDLALPETGYQFTFFDAKGEQVYQESGSAFLLPNDKKYLVVPRFTSQQPVKGANFSWTQALAWQKRASIPQINIQTSSPNTYNQFIPPAFVAEGNYLNNSPYQLAKVRLTFLVLDRTGAIVAVSRRDDSTVAPYERRSYKQLWPNVYGDPSYAMKIFAETNPLDPQNLTLPATPTTPASDLSRPSGKNN